MRTENLLGYSYKQGRRTFRAIDPSDGKTLEGDFHVATEEEAASALLLAEQAFQSYRHTGPKARAGFLRAIAAGIGRLGEELIDRAMAETGLPRARIEGERARTTAQLQLFAELVEEGSWVDAVIDIGLPERQPAPRPDLRRMLVPLGPAVIFGASNFPLAFSVAGGDTASALAAGCPVVVKAHPAHPGTSALVGEAIRRAAEECELADGVFSLLYDDGYAIGEALVCDPRTSIVTFTGSYRGGMALMHLASGRTKPIPVFAEMGSVNPTILFPEALEARYMDIAKQYAASITLGAGQFCTNPGLLIGLKNPALDRFAEALAEAIANVAPATMLSRQIGENYERLSGEMLDEPGVALLASGKATPGDALQARALVAKVSASSFLVNPKLLEEVFGPWSLLVMADYQVQLEQVVEALAGQLTATVVAEPGDFDRFGGLIEKISGIAGRVILNNVPTGVEVVPAMQHGGPFPATTDSRFTSVGPGAIRRFLRPLCWQNWKEDLLPEALRNGNPLGIWRRVNNEWTKSAL